jgi:hypothetical protein
VTGFSNQGADLKIASIVNRAMLRLMGDLLKLIWCFVFGLFRSRALLEAEIPTLRHQLNVLQRKAPKRLVFSNFDRLVFASLYRLIPGILNTLVIIKPERSSAGIGPGFACSGDGSRARAAADRGSRSKSAN